MKRIFSVLFAFLLCGLWACVWENPSNDITFLPLDDSEYPYAEVPRLVIETEDLQEIRNREDKIPAKLQIYGVESPSSSVLGITIKGRGFSSFEMPKYSYKIEFNEKISLFDFPKNRDFVLIANFRDKSHLKNFITYKLANNLGDDFSPKSKFVELYLNRKYEGLYLLTESIKVGNQRVKIAKNDSSFLFEKTTPPSNRPSFQTSNKNLFEIRYPKDVSQQSFNLLKNHINSFELLIKNNATLSLDSLNQWLDIDDFIRYYWIQEFSKNYDGRFLRSILLTWEKGGPIKMGPVWDFDLAYGIHRTGTSTPEGWLIRDSGWNKWLWKNDAFAKKAQLYWRNNYPKIEFMTDSIETFGKLIQRAIKNDNKRWPVLNTSENKYHETSYESYLDAIDSLKAWCSQRSKWIDSHL
ncbi:MAG: CotH kinase family protein [Fibrobacter sp.]|nr:CotH kinase family protein [Fibrobacter sp.]